MEKEGEESWQEQGQAQEEQQKQAVDEKSKKKKRMMMRIDVQPPEQHKYVTAVHTGEYSVFMSVQRSKA